MADGGTVNINLVAKYEAFLAGMEKAEARLAAFGKSVAGVGHLAEAFLGYEAIKSVAEWVEHTMEAVEQQHKLALSLGVSQQSMQELGYSATLTGVNAGVLGSAMLKMEENLSGVGAESAKTKDALAAIGLTMGDLRGKNGDQQLRMIATGMETLSSSGARARVAVDLFGKSGAELLPLLGEGAEKMAAQAQEARELGIAIDDVDSQKIVDANEEWKKAGQILDGGLLAVTKELSPLIQGVIEYLIDAVKQAGGFGTIASTAMEYLVTGIGVAVDAFNVLKLAWDAIKAAAYGYLAAATFVWEKVATAVLTVGTLVNQFANVMGDTGRYISREWDVVWGQVKLAAATATQFMGNQLANFLHSLAEGLSTHFGSIATALLDVEGKVRTATGHMAGDSKEALKIVQQDADFTANKLLASWDKLGDTSNVKNNPIIKFLQASHGYFMQAGGEAADDFMKQWDKVLNQTGSNAFKAWFAAQKQAAQQHAEEETRRQRQQIANDHAVAATELAIETDKANEIRSSLDKTVLAENEDFDRRLKQLKAYHDKSLLSDAEFKLAEQKLTQEHQRNLADITVHQEEQVTKWEVMNSKEKEQFTVGALNNLATLQQSHNRKMFEVGKAAAYASTVISTAKAAMEAYSALAGIYLVGPALGAAAAAAAIAAGAMQLQNIRSSSFDGGGTVTSGGFGGSPTVTAGGSQFGPTTATPGVSGAAAPPPIQISVSGLDDHMVYSGAFFRNLIDKINEAQRNGSPVDTVGVV